jgi:mevalonate kinase
MPATSATAPAKVILFGEHSVVYGKPAIAVPVHALKTRVVIQALPKNESDTMTVFAPDVDLDVEIRDLSSQHPIVKAIDLVKEHFNLEHFPSCKIEIYSDIPPASGLGSSAAVSVAIIRALTSFLGHPIDDETVNHYAFIVEKIHHTTPSGIDNTTIAFNKPVFFMQSKQIEFLKVNQPFSLLIADSGIRVPTSIAVAQVRQYWGLDKCKYESIFSSIESLTYAARDEIIAGNISALGELMNANHDLLVQMQLSTPLIDNMIKTALDYGALGAKISGGGLGGNMIALIDPEQAELIKQALFAAGAKSVIGTTINETGI